MPTNSIQTSETNFNSPKSHYREAYSFVRRYFRARALGYSEHDLGNMLGAALRVLGEDAIAAAWKAHFASRVANVTGIGSEHGWHNAPRCRRWNSLQAKYGDFRFVHSQWL